MPHRFLSGLTGAAALIWGGLLTVTQDVRSLAGVVRPHLVLPPALFAAAVRPDIVQPWVSLANTTLLTLGTTLLVLRQRWIRIEADRKHDTLLSENADLKARMIQLDGKVEVLTQSGCARAIECPNRVVPAGSSDSIPRVPV